MLSSGPSSPQIHVLVGKNQTRPSFYEHDDYLFTFELRRHFSMSPFGGSPRFGFCSVLVAAPLPPRAIVFVIFGADASVARALKRLAARC